jgi:hypothetical protein
VRIDPPRRASWIAVGLILAGWAVIAISWYQAAGRAEVWQQLPIALSGGGGGVAAIGLGVCILAAQVSRVLDAEEREQLDEILERSIEAVGRAGSVRGGDLHVVPIPS